MQTRITELLGISCPIICAGMSVVATTSTLMHAVLVQRIFRSTAWTVSC